jgi:hypothetical protein
MRGGSLWPALLVIFTLGCGGGSAPTSSGASGAYEFVVTSNVTGGTTLVESNLAANGNQSSAAGSSGVQVLTLENKIYYINGICPGSTPGQNSVTATVTGKNNVAVAFDVGGNGFTGQGSMAGPTILGSYSITGSKCANLIGNINYPNGFDSGGYTGTPVTDLAGTFTGILSLPSGVDNATLTLKENSDKTMVVNADLSGPADNGNFTFSGSAVGNVMLVSGSVNGRALTLFGYRDITGSLTGVTNSLLVFDHDTQAKAGLLLKP